MNPVTVARSGSPPGTANQIHHGVNARAASGTTPFMFVTKWSNRLISRTKPVASLTKLFAVKEKQAIVGRLIAL